MKKAIFHSCKPLQVILASTLEYHGITVSRTVSRYHGTQLYHDDPTYHKRRRFLQRQAVRHHRGGIVPDIYIKHWQHATAAGRHGTAEQMYGVKAIGIVLQLVASAARRGTGGLAGTGRCLRFFRRLPVELRAFPRGFEAIRWIEKS